MECGQQMSRDRKAESFTFRVGKDAGQQLAEMAQFLFEGKPGAMKDYLDGMEAGLKTGKEKVMRGLSRKRGRWVRK